MKTKRDINFKFFSIGRITVMITAVLLLAFSNLVLAQYEDYRGPEFCAECHEANYNKWQASGHPYKLMKSEQARNRPIPLPNGISWDDVTYVIGGYKWKSRYVDDRGYIITTTLDEDGNPIPGVNQYNYLTGEWSDYHAGEVDKPYDCGRCHTTAWIQDDDFDTDMDLSDNQDGLPGMHGTFFAGGVQCEQCHGPGFEMSLDDSAEFCGTCHYRGDTDTIPASGGFIKHHEQYNEFLASPHASFDCTTCHDPHLRGEFSIKDTAQCGVSCHSGIGASYAQTSMADYGVECQDCHLPYATKSAQALGPYQGDVKTHIWSIDTDPDGNMFTEDGLFVNLDDNGKAAVTMDFACQRCHETASLDELALYAKDFHDTDKGLEDIGIDPGLTGTWWGGPARDGEGFVLEVGYANGALYMFGSFYTYDDMGNQVYLVALSTSMDGTTANVDIYITQGRMWGDDFDPADGGTVLWGTGMFTFPTCGTGTFTLMPNADAMAAGFTNLSYPIERLITPGIACPTFVNNAMAVAQ